MADARLVVASAARTTTGTSGANAIPDGANKVSVLVAVSAVSGTTPSMTASLEWSDDAGTTWAVADPADSFTAITAATTVVKEFAVKAAAYRVKWTITGTTPSFTFSVSDYCTP